MFCYDYDISFCGNKDNCPKKDSCLRAINLPPGIYTYSLFNHSEETGCEYYIKKDEDEATF